MARGTAKLLRRSWSHLELQLCFSLHQSHPPGPWFLGATVPQNDRLWVFGFSPLMRRKSAHLLTHLQGLRLCYFSKSLQTMGCFCCCMLLETGHGVWKGTELGAQSNRLQVYVRCIPICMYIHIFAYTHTYIHIVKHLSMYMYIYIYTCNVWPYRYRPIIYLYT